MANPAKKAERDRAYGAPLGPAASIEAVPARNKAQEADELTRRAAIKADRESSIAEGKKGLYQGRTEAPAGAGGNGKLDISIEKTAGRLRNRRKQIDDASAE